MAEKSHARTKRIVLDESWRLKIKGAQLLDRLQSFALGVPDNRGHEVHLSRDHIKAIEILLRKLMPDLAAVELSGQVHVRHEDALAQLR